jgi:hypothetical protein
VKGDTTLESFKQDVANQFANSAEVGQDFELRLRRGILTKPIPDDQLVQLANQEVIITKKR